jgi:hypothetical protein
MNLTENKHSVFDAMKWLSDGTGIEIKTGA